MATVVIAVVNVMTKMSDARGYGRDLPLADPLVTEFSSALAIILLLAPVFVFFDKMPLTRGTWQRALVPYIGASLVFSVLHVMIMVMIRKVAWPILFDGSYVFFTTGFSEALYEYRKDLVSFLLYFTLHKLQRQVKMAGKAGREKAPVVLKSGATTILLHPYEFLFAKAAGNYVDIISRSGTQLARITLAELEKLLRDYGCDVVRIHRSYIVNRATIMETSPLAGGDLNVKLKNGEILRASRRYKDRLDH
ncbi:LytTR family DNA-binding domain-containing protein [Emcibacter sp.]|uniref:LytTR family DNA-binding domain-containing protein n=1 Tax=Emcibacter sp. TaxID=1979954 RepID=UPI002AA7C7F2|nr:LytTR family DNA-binding domain-containing protein [Emcibacter sp.]